MTNAAFRLVRACNFQGIGSWDKGIYIVLAITKRSACSLLCPDCFYQRNMHVSISNGVAGDSLKPHNICKEVPKR